MEKQKLLPPEIVTQVQTVFEQLKEPVQVLLFTSRQGCDYCSDVQQLLEEVTELSDKLALSVHDLEAEPELAQRYQVENKAPALVIAANENGQIVDTGVRYLGIPSGHEFNTLIQALLLVSGRDSGLKEQTRAYARALTEPLHLQVFVTPT